jgi:hypothetical protein
VLGGSAPSTSEIELPGDDGNYPLVVVGESQYQAILEQICGGRTELSVQFACRAQLVREDTNPYDRNAIRVVVDGKTVGYLQKPDAVAYRQFLNRRGTSSAIGVCDAEIRGGWDRETRGTRDRGHFGIWLDFKLYD